MRLLNALLPLLLLCAPAQAQELSGALGRLHEIGGRDATYAWQFQYLHPLESGWAASFTWLNEGHLPDHHRDGAALQVWRFHRMEHNHLKLGVALGSYRSFDTTADGPPGDFRNRHDLKGILSLRAQYPGPSGAWEGFVQLNRILGPGEPRTQALLVGLSARLGGPDSRDSSPDPTPSLSDTTPRNEFSILLGRTILNSLQSEQSNVPETFALEYRRRLDRHLELTFTYCDEGGIDAVKRDALAAQIWVTTRGAANAWLLGAGFGPYFSRTFPSDDPDSHADTVNIRTSLRYSMVVGRHLWGRWGARLQWNRTLTRYHRDTDVLLGGLAYAW